jgi:hypothetical protein
VGTTVEGEAPQEAGTLGETKMPQEAGTLGETKMLQEAETLQEARTTAAEAARTQQVSRRMSLELRRKMRRLQIRRQQQS